MCERHKATSMRIWFSLVTIILMFPAIAFAQPIRLTINGHPLEMEAPPIVQGGRTLVPLRPIFEVLGAAVRWDAKTRTITGNRDNKAVILTIGNHQAIVNGNHVTLDVPPTVIGGRTMVPVRFIADGFGARATWDNRLRTVSIRSDGAPIPAVPLSPAIAARQLEKPEIQLGELIENRNVWLRQHPIQANGMIRLEGRTTESYLMALVSKGDSRKPYSLRLKDGNFVQDIFLLDGKGEYEIRVMSRLKQHSYLTTHLFLVVNEKTVNNFLVPADQIESDHPEIVQMARQIIQGKTSDREKIKAVYDWVRKNIVYDDEKARRITNNNWHSDYFGALHTLRKRTGVCQDYSSLAAALLRAVGIPSALISGLTDVGYHAWNRAFDAQNNRWIVFDATFASTSKKSYFDRNLSATHKAEEFR